MRSEIKSSVRSNAKWAVILAGGEGTRLRPLTRLLAGDDRPKQFCSLIGNDTLLQQTRGRVAYVVPAHRTLLVVTKSHERFFHAQLADRSSPLIVQPQNRGTAAAILYSLLDLSRRDRNANVAFFPSDHYIANNALFMARVDSGFRIIEQRPDLVVLLGIVPDRPEVEYGWIEPAERIAGFVAAAPMRVCRFWEKPALGVAQNLFACGCLWNSFVTIGAVDTLLQLIRKALPEFCRPFEARRTHLGTRLEIATIDHLYSQSRSMDFSRDVLAVCPDSLAVLPVEDAGWIDMGHPDRALPVVLRCRAITGRSPDC